EGDAEVGRLVAALAPDFGAALAKHPALEDVTRLCQEAARHLSTLGGLREGGEPVDAAAALAVRESLPRALVSRTAEARGAERKTFAGEVLGALEKHRTELWRERVKKQINWELFDTGMEAYTWLALEELARAAQGVKDHEGRTLPEGARRGPE